MTHVQDHGMCTVRYNNSHKTNLTVKKCTHSIFTLIEIIKVTVAPNFTLKLSFETFPMCCAYIITELPMKHHESPKVELERVY